MLAGVTAMDTPGLPENAKSLNDLPIFCSLKYRRAAQMLKCCLKLPSIIMPDKQEASLKVVI
jgi:hypothetical protein